MERLQLDHIDVLQCKSLEHLLRARPSDIHGQAIGLTTTRRLKRRCVIRTDSPPLAKRPDFLAQMQALHDVVQAGYVRYIGMSSCYAYQCECLFPSYIEYAPLTTPSMLGQYNTSIVARSASSLSSTTTLACEEKILQKAKTTADEPQNLLTRKFTKKEWIALRRLRVSRLNLNVPLLVP